MKPLTLEEKDKYYMSLSKEILPLPPRFKDGKWEVDYSEDGKLCYLKEGWGTLWMGNDVEEKYSMIKGAIDMYGDCLVLGLGIGLVVQYINKIGHCRSVTVIENSSIVIKHIGPWLKKITNIPIEIIKVDDEKFLEKTNRKWHTLYADTWEMCTDALEKIENLKKIAKGKISGKKIFWAEAKLKYNKRREM